MATQSLNIGLRRQVTEQVVLTFGLNDRTNNNTVTLGKILERLIEAAKGAFPGAKIYVPMINFDQTLPGNKKANLRSLNKFILESGCSITLLPGEQFGVGEDKLHWTPATARAIFCVTGSAI